MSEFFIAIEQHVWTATFVYIGILLLAAVIRSGVTTLSGSEYEQESVAE